MAELIGIELNRYVTRIASVSIQNGNEIDKNNLHEFPPIIDFIQTDQTDKITKFFFDLKSRIKFNNNEVFITLPDSMLRIDLRETDYVQENQWEDEFSKSIKQAIPQLSEEPYCFTYPLVTSHPDNEKRCFVTTVSVKRKFINTLLAGAKAAGIVITNINATAIALCRFINVWDKPYFILTVEHDRASLAVSFSNRGIDLAHESVGWGEMLNSSKGLEKILQQISIQNSRIRSRGLSTKDQSPLIIVSEEAESIKKLLESSYSEIITVKTPTFIRTNFDNVIAFKYAAAIGSTFNILRERGQDYEDISVRGSNSNGRVRRTRLFEVKAKFNTLINSFRALIGHRTNL